MKNQLKAVVINNFFENQSLKELDIVIRMEGIAMNELVSEIQDDSDELGELEQLSKEVIYWINWERINLWKWDNRDYIIISYIKFDNDKPQQNSN